MRRLLAAIVTVAALTLLAASPAWAHDETGEFSATRAEANSSGTYTVDVLLTYTNDGHGAEGATVTVTAQGPSGDPIPVPMVAGDRAGAYTGDVALDTPGEYTITASSPDPVAETTFSVTVAAPTTTTTEAPATTTTDEPATTTTAAAEDEESSEDPPWWTALIFVGIGAGIGVAIVRWRNARKAAEPS